MLGPRRVNAVFGIAYALRVAGAMQALCVLQFWEPVTS
jgi:hypothetical protein